MCSIRIILAIVLLALLSACSVSSRYTVTSKTNDIYGSTVIHNPMVADLDVQERKITEEYSSEGSMNPTNSEIESAKNHATANALKKSSADILIEPNYEVRITPSGHQKTIIKVVVTGYPATYSNFRNVRMEDLAIIEKTASIKMMSTAEKSNATQYDAPEEIINPTLPL